MNEFEDRIDEWAKTRRAENKNDRGFTVAVMERIDCSAHPEPPRSSDHRVVPAPLFASLCLLAGFGKLALVLHLAF